MGIEYDAFNPQQNIEQIEIPHSNSSQSKTYSHVVEIIEKSTNRKLILVGNSKDPNIWKTEDDEYGYVLLVSKLDMQKKRNEYFYAYREKASEKIGDCKNVLYVFACRSNNFIVALPKEEIEKYKYRCRNTERDSGEVSHWHIYLDHNKDGRITWKHSIPEMVDFDVKSYCLSTE